MKHLLVLLFILTFTFCSTTPQKAPETSPQKTTVQPTSDKCSIQSLDVQYQLHPPFEVRSFIYHASAKVYCLPDTNSEVIKTFPFNGRQFSLENCLLYKGEFWYKLKGSRPDFINGGYIKADALSNYYMGQSKYNLGYLGKVIHQSEELGDKFVLKRFDTKTLEIFQEYTFSNYLKYHKLENVYHHTFKNADYLFYFTTESDECPGGYYEEYVIECNNKLVKLWASPTDGSDEESETSDYYKIYLPITSANKVILAPGGKFENILQPDLSHDLIDTPPHSEVSLNLVAVEKTTTDMEGNELKKDTVFYQWNGKGLIELP